MTITKCDRCGKEGAKKSPVLRAQVIYDTVSEKRYYDREYCMTCMHLFLNRITEFDKDFFEGDLGEETFLLGPVP